MEAIKSGRSTIKFMIIMPWGRVGSNLLFSSIEDAAHGRKPRFANENFIAIKDPKQQIEWTREFYGRADGFDLVGTKQNIFSVRNLEDMGNLLADIGVRLIRMRRANLVKVAISQLRAELYAERNLALRGFSTWGVRQGQEPLGPVVLKPQRFLRAVARARDADALLAQFAPAVATIETEYREIQADPSGVTARVCEWLGMTVEEEVVPTFIKATPDDLSLAVPNLDELRAALRASPLAHLDPMFDE